MKFIIQAICDLIIYYVSQNSYCQKFISVVIIMDQKMAQQLRPSKSASKKPKIDWSRREEADNFAHVR